MTALSSHERLCYLSSDSGKHSIKEAEPIYLDPRFRDRRSLKITLGNFENALDRPLRRDTETNRSGA